MAKVKEAPPAKKNSKKTVIAPKTKTIINPTKKIALSQEQVEESIRLKAYELYLQRLGQDGTALNDWLSAEKIVLQA